MAVVFLAPGVFGAGGQLFTSGGIPLDAGLVYTTIAGGSTPAATYTTSAGSVQNANPIELNADGRFPDEVWLVEGTAYRFTLRDSLGNLIDTYDNLTGIGDLSPQTTAFTRSLLLADDAAEARTLLDAGQITPQDTVFRIVNNPDQTKKIAFDASGITTATTRTITAPDFNLSSWAGVAVAGGPAQGQILFPATQAPSSNVNTLDDYEEGPDATSWVPVLEFGLGTTGITYASKVGVYIKIGKLVIATFTFTLTSKGSSTGAATVSGLPFPSSTNGQWLGPVTWTGMTSSYVSMDCEVTGGASRLNIRGLTAAGTSFSAAADTGFANTSVMSGVIMYMADA